MVKRLVDPLRARPWLVLGLFYLAAAVALFSRELFGFGQTPVHFGWDVIEQYWPDVAFRFRALWQGEWPLWNPYTHGGMPFASRSQTMLFYPPSWLLLPFALPDGVLPLTAYECFIVGHFALGALGMHRLAMTLGARPLWAGLSGLTTMLCAPIMTQKDSAVLYAVMWIPWLMDALITLCERPSSRHALYLAIVGICTSTSGTPPGVYYAALMALCVAPLALASGVLGQGPFTIRRAGRILGLGLAASLLVLLASLPTYGPNLQILKDVTHQGGGEAYVMHMCSRFAHLYSFVNAHHPQTWWFDLFVGLLPLLALPAALAAGPRRYMGPMLALALFFMWIAIGDPEGGVLIMAEHLPGYDLQRKAHRYSILVTLLLMPLFARGMTELLPVDQALKPERRRRLLLASVMLAAVALYLLADKHPEGGDANTKLSLTLLPYELAALFLLVAVPTFAAGKVRSCALACLCTLHLSHMVWANSDRFAVVQHLDQSGEAEVIGASRARPGYRMWPTSGVRRGFENRALVRFAHGYPYPMQLEKHMHLMVRLHRDPSLSGLFNVSEMAPPFREYKRYRRFAKGIGHGRFLHEAPRPWLALYPGVRQAASNKIALDLWHESEQRGQAVLCEGSDNDATRALQGRTGSALLGRVTNFAINSVTGTINAPHAGMVVLNEVYYPGWSVTVDGRPADLVEVNRLLRGVVVGPGPHRLHYRYMPPYYPWWLAAFALALVGLGLLWMRSRAREGR